MSGLTILLIILGYFGVLFGISLLTSRKADENTYFKGNNSSPWYLVAFGMIGASLSGVTFISVPGWVATSNFSYMQVVLGYLAGYAVIGLVLMPLYYRLNLTSIYGYLEERFGTMTYKTGAGFFLLSRTIGASFRLFLVAIVFQFILEKFGYHVPFVVPVFISIALIFIYTFRGGIKTVVWTDTLQTLFMLVSAGLSVWWIKDQLGFDFGEMASNVGESEYAKTFFWDWGPGNNFFKQFFSGAFIAIVMTGLDQDMMQKNLTCRNLGEAQKNMFTFSIVLVFVNLAFLTLGALLYMYGTREGLVSLTGPDGNFALSIADVNTGEMAARRTDELFPILSLDYFPPYIGILFILGLIAAAYSSADSALTSLTTSFCVDFLNFEKDQKIKNRTKTRYLVQLSISVIIFLLILTFRGLNDKAIIDNIFTAAGYTYGPLLGLYAFGLFTKIKIHDNLALIVCIAAPVLTFLINLGLPSLTSFNLGFLILPLNGLLTFLGLLAISKKEISQ
ncbi:MAG: sodium:solute symporter [Bacteroidia bacterium]|nr:sodium:solute symporter [Bacteroidia bacterium]